MTFGSPEMTLSYLEPPLSGARVDGAMMTWREAGEGAGLPLFLMHGVGTNARLWAGQFAGFSGERRVVAWNAPGYAGSDPVAPEFPTARDYAKAAVALLDHLAIPACVVIGQSLGSVMAAELAVLAPQRVAALALTSPAAGHAVAPGAPMPEVMASRLHDAATLTPAQLAERRAPRLLSAGARAEARAIVQQAMSEVDPHGYAQAVRMFAGADLPGMVGQVRAPTLVMWGDADVVTRPDECLRVAMAVKGAERHELAGVGHAMAAEDPAAFNAVLRPFIARADAACGRIVP